jgi:hypothetical protein
MAVSVGAAIGGESHTKPTIALTRGRECDDGHCG